MAGKNNKAGRTSGGSALRPGKTAKLKATAPDGTVKKNPWKGIPAGDRQGMREAIALRYGKPDPAVDAMRRRQAKPAAPGNSFDAMRRRVVRTRMTNGGLTFDTSDRPKQGYKNLTAGLNRARAYKTYRQQAGRPLGELTGDRLRAPYGRFSTIKNPAPAKSFPSQAPGRTKAGELVAREARKAAKRKR